MNNFQATPLQNDSEKRALYIIPGGVFLGTGTYLIYEKVIRALIRMVLNLTL